MNQGQVQHDVERFQDAVNRGDSAAADGLMAADMVDHAPWPGHTPNAAGFKAGLAEMRASFPDLHVTVQRTVSEADRLAVHYRISGTQLGTFMGAPATGRTFDVQAIDIVRLSGDRVAEHWGLIDEAGMAGQLGLR